MRNPNAIFPAPALTARLAGMTSLAVFLFAAPFHAALAQTAPSLGAASGFTVLSGGAVTCTDSTVVGDVGAGGAFTNTRCTIAGGMPPATTPAVPGALADFRSAYAALALEPCTTTFLDAAFTGQALVLTPGVYCFPAAATFTDTTLTLDGLGNANAVWIFRIGTQATGALTGTNLSVVMANGGQPCNVFWAPSAAVTMTTSALKGTILAGDVVGGSITLTGGSLAGRALADVAVTMTGATSVIGCGALTATVGKDKCDADDDDDNDRDHDRDHDKNKRHHHKHHDRDHDKDQDRDHRRMY